MATILVLSLIFAVQADAQMERGVKSDELEEIILVSGDNWHNAVAATPLAIWTEDNQTEMNPLLILPRNVDAGERIGWVGQSELERYGPTPVLHTMRSANISALVIHGEGEMTKSMVELAQKEGIKAYVTVTLDSPEDTEEDVTEADLLEAEDDEEAVRLAKDLFFQEIGIEELQAESSVDLGSSEQLDFDLAQLAIGPDGTVIVSDRFCPVNPDAREDLYNRIEDLIEDYEVDGVVLYDFGFLGEDYCLCDVCKEEFYGDTGIDLSMAGSSSYNLQRWKRWKEEQVLEVVREARNITTEMGPVSLGVAIPEPFDRSEGYNYAEISELSDLMIINPVPSPDLKVAAEMTETPVYVRLSDDYVEYTISTQNVEGAVEYMEDLVDEGAAGLAFEYDVVYTPLWYELEPPTPAARWLLDRLEGRTLCIGDVSWDCDSRIVVNDSFEMAEAISQRWERSPGAVLVEDNYTAALAAATIASYLNWPVLFTGEELPNSTRSALSRLGATQIVTTGAVSEDVREGLEDLNLTIIEGDREFLLREMRSRGDEIGSVVLTNSHDLSLLQPKPESVTERYEIDDLLLDVKVNPAKIPSESAGEIVRLGIKLTNRGDEDLEDVVLSDVLLPTRFVIWWSASAGEVELKDILIGEEPDPDIVFFDGTQLNWSIDRLGPHEYATLDLEVEILHALDAGWTQPLDAGITVTHADEEGENEEESMSTVDDGPIVNITYPSRMPAGRAEISWEVTREPYVTYLNYYNPEGESDYVAIWDCGLGRECNVTLLLTKPGTWTFNIETWRTAMDLEHLTENFTIDVSSSAPPINVTAFSHTKIPRLSLTSAQMAAARNGLIFDVAEDPQNLDPVEIEEDMEAMAEELDISPEYLIVVGGPGSLPFPSTGLMKQNPWPYEFDIYREYQIQLDDDDYQEVASGRIIGLSVYDASQTVARTLAYDEIGGSWKDRALIISSPTDYPTWPQSPIPLRIGEYLRAAGLDAVNLREEEATYQRITSKMNNGQNIVHFDYHGAEWGWQLSLWDLIDSIIAETEVKQLTLAPQTTTTNSCLTSRLKGRSIPFTDEIDFYIPMRLEDSMALAFLRAGSVNYVGANALSRIFLAGDHKNNLYQAMVFENDTLGKSLMSANNLYIVRMKSAEGIGFDEVDETFPVDWSSLTAEIMINETVNAFMLFGDPTFRPSIPETPSLPYQTDVMNETDEVEVAIVPTMEWGTDWIYWIQVDTVDGDLRLNAPPALLGEMILPKDAEEIVIKERGRVVWHDEDTVGSQKRVIWPVISPKLNETRSFTVEYRLVPGQVQVINVTVGWNPVSLHLDPADPSVDRNFKRKPYRSIFTVEGNGWNYSMEGDGVKNVTELMPGRGYVIDSAEDFTVEISGKPVDLPYRVELHEGWNLVGVPLNETVQIANVTVNANHKKYNYSEAVEEGVVSAFLWNYSDGEWVYVSQNESMLPGEAYMMEAMSDCRLEFG